MCDYCDCRSHPEIAELSMDHERLMALLSHLHAATRWNDRDAATGLMRTLHELLHRHTAREERGVFAELRSQAGDGSVVMFEDDHTSIHDLLDRAGTDEWASVAEQLVDRLSEHMLLEETYLLPCRPPAVDARSVGAHHGAGAEPLMIRANHDDRRCRRHPR